MHGRAHKCSLFRALVALQVLENELSAGCWAGIGRGVRRVYRCAIQGKSERKKGGPCRYHHVLFAIQFKGDRRRVDGRA